MIGYKFAYRYHNKDIIFNTSDNFDEICYVEGRNKIYEFITGRNILDDFILWCNDLIICANKTIFIRPDTYTKMTDMISRLYKIRDNLLSIINGTQLIFEEFRLLREKVIDRLYHAELLDNYFCDGLKVNTIKLKYNENESKLFYNSFYHGLINKFNNNGYSQRMNNYMELIKNYNHIDELNDWIYMLIYSLYKSGNYSDLITKLMKLCNDAMNINRISLNIIDEIKVLQEIYMNDFLNYYVETNEK